ADGPFTTALYNDPTAAGGTRPVWSVMPECAIVSPAPDARLTAGETTIWGWAWGALPVARVEVSTDGGACWRVAALEPRRQFAWQRFSLSWRPEQPGPAVVTARAADVAGTVQPLTAARNAVHAVTVTIEGAQGPRA